MQARRVLVTGAGAGPGVAVIKALSRSNHDGEFVLGVDMSRRAAGLYLADDFELIPAAGSDEFVPRLLELASKHSLNMIIPILDVEAAVVATHRSAFESRGIMVAANSSDCIANCHDKRRAYSICETSGIAQPRRFDSPDQAPKELFPLIGKPAMGVGARGIVLLENPAHSPPKSTHQSEYVWQQFVRGEEYSIDTFGAPSASYFVAVPRLRRVVRSGQMVQGSTMDDPALLAFAAQVCSAFRTTDVCCIQVIRAAGGELHFVECNPRYGTGISLSIAAGVDFPRLQWLARVAPQEITATMTQFKPGLEMLRYWEEIYL
jgi:carbamoyl-phosphate synthase large subunit